MRAIQSSRAASASGSGSATVMQNIMGLPPVHTDNAPAARLIALRPKHHRPRPHDSTSCRGFQPRAEIFRKGSCSAGSGQHPVRRRDGADGAAGDARSQDSGRDVLRHHAAGGDDRPVSDGDAGITRTPPPIQTPLPTRDGDRRTPAPGPALPRPRGGRRCRIHTGGRPARCLQRSRRRRPE